MMEWTDRHCRYLHRLLSRRVLLYTEMVTSAAIVHGDRDRLLGFDPAEHPVAVQLGGSEPAQLAEAARIAEDFGYDEINLNVGCPSDRVQSGRFGASLMAEPGRVADCVAAMKRAVAVPVTVKCRLGIDDQDTEETLDRFVATILDAGTDALTVHARKAWLKGLSPKENRDIPPLDYDRVHRLKARFTTVPILLNGGLQSLDEAMPHLDTLDGVMFGRAAYQRPAMLHDVDSRIFGEAAPLSTIDDVVTHYADYARRQVAAGVPVHHLTHPLLGLFHGTPGARGWRRRLTVEAHRKGADAGLIDIAHRESLDARAARRTAA